MTTGSAWRRRPDSFESGREPGRVGKCHEKSAIGESPPGRHPLSIISRFGWYLRKSMTGESGFVRGYGINSMMIRHYAVRANLSCKRHDASIVYIRTCGDREQQRP